MIQRKCSNMYYMLAAAIIYILCYIWHKLDGHWWCEHYIWIGKGNQVTWEKRYLPIAFWSVTLHYIWRKSVAHFYLFLHLDIWMRLMENCSFDLSDSYTNVYMHHIYKPACRERTHILYVCTCIHTYIFICVCLE